MSKILDFFTGLFAKKNLIIFILLAAVAFLIFLKLQSCGNSKVDSETAKQDQQAMKKDITVTETKSGLSQSSIIAYEGQIKDLKTYSSSLEKAVADLKNRKPTVIIQTKTVYIGDTSTKAKNVLTDEKNGNYDLSWIFTKDTSRTVKGITKFNAKANIAPDGKSYTLNILPGTTQLLEDELKLDFTVGVALNKKTGYDEIFVTPSDKNVHIGKLEGAILDKNKPQYFSIGPSLGYGVIYTGGNFKLGPYIGLSVNYNLTGQFKNLFKKSRKAIPSVP